MRFILRSIADLTHTYLFMKLLQKSDVNKLYTYFTLLLFILCISCTSHTNHHESEISILSKNAGIHWIRDDYDAARQLAIQTRRPLLIDFWAPWCHSCLSMKNTVLKDPALSAFTKRYVWLSLDTDKASNATIVKRFPVQIWPTFIVVDGDTEQLQARLLGSSTLASFKSFLEIGLHAFDHPVLTDQPKPLDPSQTVVLAERMATIGQADQARRFFQTAETRSVKGVARCDLAFNAVHLEYSQGNWSRCFDKVRNLLDMVSSCVTMSGVELVRFGDICVSRLGKTADIDTVKLFRSRALQVVNTLCEKGANTFVPDDLSGCLKIKRELADKLGNKRAARSFAQAQRALLDRITARAKSPEEIMIYNWPRAEVYTYLGIPGALVTDLEANILALPNEYDPPYRLAWVLLKDNRPAEALAPARQALTLVYGPRKGRVFGLIADIYLALGDFAKARLNFAKAHAIYASMDDQRSLKWADLYRNKMKSIEQ